MMEGKKRGLDVDVLDSSGSFSDLSKESFIGSLSSLSVKYGESLWDLWVQMGCSSGSFGAYRSEVVHNCLEEKFKAMIEEEEGHKSALINNIDEHYKRLYSLSKELSISLEEPPADLSLIRLEKALRDRVECLKKKKKDRLSELTSLKKQDVKLAGMLGEEAHCIQLSCIPSKEEALSLRAHVKKLSELRQERLSTLRAHKKSIIAVMNQLDTEPANSFERAIVCEEDESFLPLSEDRLRSVAKTLERLQAQVQQNMREAERMRSRIRDISTKLEMDEREISEFLNEYSGFSPNELKELQFRLDELELLKVQHMERFIVSSRKELCEWWDKCFYNHKQRSLFSPLYSTNYSEELLLEHEQEIEKIKTYYYTNESLFHMVEQRHTLWEKKLELEKKAKDPNRFNCKSTEFLKEEKDRKRVEKQLPKIEKSLEDAMEQYKSENGIEFLIGGLPYQTYMDIQIKEHEESLQREKIEKANAKKQLLIQESRYGSTPAKLNSTKRKAPNTVDYNMTKKHKSDVTRGTVNSTKSSTRSTLTRSTSARCASARTASNRSRRLNNQQSSFVTGSTDFKMTLRSLGDKDPFLNPRAINANSTLQTELTPHNIKRTPRTTLTTGGRALNRRSRSAVQLNSKKSPVVTAKKSLFKTPTSKRVLTPVNSSIRSSTLRSKKNNP